MNSSSSVILHTEYVSLKLILPITSIGILMSAMDGSIVNVSLKTIADELNTNKESISWVVVAYLLTISSLLGISGSLGDLYGRKKIFQLGMLIFSIGSLFCSFSTSLTMLVISRVIQASGASGIIANGLAIVVTFIDPKLRGRAIGINSLVVAGSIAIGPVIGGILTQYYGWQSIFIINVPIGMIGFLATQLFIKETERKKSISLDFIGMGLFTIITFSFITGIMFLFRGYPLASLLVFLSIISAILFYFQQDKHPNPMIPVDIMKNRQIMMGISSATFAYMSLYSIIFLFPFYLQEVRNLNQSTTGLYMVIIPLALILTGPPTGFLAERIKAKKLATLGIVLQTSFMIILSTVLLLLKANNTLISILIIIGIIAACLSVFTTSNSTSVMNAAPKNKISIVSGTLNLSRTVGFTLGTAISSTLFTFVEKYYNPDNKETGSDFEVAYYNAIGMTFLFFAILNVIAIILSYSRGDEKVV